MDGDDHAKLNVDHVDESSPLYSGDPSSPLRDLSSGRQVRHLAGMSSSLGVEDVAVDIELPPPAILPENGTSDKVRQSPTTTRGRRRLKNKHNDPISRTVIVSEEILGQPAKIMPIY